MQTHQIKNHMMSLTVAEHGAEITSIQLEGIERMWDADPAFWGRTAPVLFPIVGALKDNSYRYEGQTYLMGQHGFARDMDFTLTDQTEDKLEFTLFDNEETYEKYPFHFQLQIIYEVFQNQCRVTWKVKSIPKVDYEKKLSGVYEHTVVKKNSPFFRGFDDVFYAPQSRAMGMHREDIEAIDELELMAISEEAGVTIVKTKDSHHFFMTCHPEYDADTLAKEYFRDLEKGMNPQMPCNYFPDDDPSKAPIVRWRSAGQLLFSNWLNYYVYQSTPYEL